MRSRGGAGRLPRSGASLWRTVSTKFGADEHVDLAELDLLDVVDVAGGSEHDEQGVVVAFELGALMGDDRVLDGQRVEPELVRRACAISVSVGR